MKRRAWVSTSLSDLHQLVNVHPSLANHQFVVHPVKAEIGVRINGTDLIQILLNLTVNAFQCSAQNHLVEIEGRMLHQPLDLTSFKDSPETRFLNVENFDNTAPLLQLSVRDDGPGIPPEVLPKIFQPYFTTKSARQGTGLGLNIVQRLMKEAKGALRVQTQVGSGTTFTIYIRAAKLGK